MARTKSLQEMIEDLHKFQFEKGFPNEFADSFTSNMYDRLQKAQGRELNLSEKQETKLVELHMRYCL